MTTQQQAGSVTISGLWWYPVLWGQLSCCFFCVAWYLASGGAVDEDQDSLLWLVPSPESHSTLWVLMAPMPRSMPSMRSSIHRIRTLLPMHLRLLKASTTMGTLQPLRDRTESGRLLQHLGFAASRQLIDYVYVGYAL